MGELIKVNLRWIATDQSQNRFDSTDAYFIVLPRIGEEVNVDVKASWRHSDGTIEESDRLYGRVHDIKHLGISGEFDVEPDIVMFIHVVNPPHLTPRVT